MSMFHELMMRKKEEIMYATIKGSLTENDGVFSGFSASNYLQIQEMLDLTSNFEIEICITPSTESLPSGAISTFIGGSFAFGISANYSGKLTAYIRNSNNDYIINGSQGQRVFVADTQYLVKLKQTKTNNIYNILISSSNDNGTSWLTEYNVNSNYPIKHDTLLNLCSAGNSSYTQQYFRGSIDLNKSYIKINSTKYNLQAVVGYTVVGSLTESPSGVFSGFSGSNYLSIPYSPTDFYANNYEFHTKVKFTSEDISANEEKYPIRYNVQSAGRGIGLNRGKLTFDFSYATGQQGRVQSSFTATADIDYYLLAKYQNGIISFQYSLDGIDYILIGTLDLSSYNKNSYLSGFYIGASPNSNYGVLKGSIDLNQTYIKINNKLWFNGQQA